MCPKISQKIYCWDSEPWCKTRERLPSRLDTQDSRFDRSSPAAVPYQDASSASFWLAELPQSGSLPGCFSSLPVLLWAFAIKPVNFIWLNLSTSGFISHNNSPASNTYTQITSTRVEDWRKRESMCNCDHRILNSQLRWRRITRNIENPVKIKEYKFNSFIVANCNDLQW